MAASESKGSRKQQILETLTRMLETNSGGKITTASLANEVGVSEAALYRHFPSKGKMFDALIDFTENTLFSRIGAITTESISVNEKCYRILAVVLTFCERNPGICRLLGGDALPAEIPRLSQRVQQIFDRLETQLKQLLKEAEYKEKISTTVTAIIATNLLMAVTEGKIRYYIRSNFSRSPMDLWADQWPVLQQALFCQVPYQDLSIS